MRKNLIFLALLFSFLYGCSSIDGNGLLKDNNNTSGPDVSYTITFDKNGGNGEMAPLLAISNSVKLTKNRFYRDGYTFIGWSTTPQGSVIYGDEETISINKDMKFYAVWQSESTGTESYYTITFNSNGGIGSMENQSVLQGKRVQVNLNEFYYNGYNFTGWSYLNNNIPEIKDGGYITLNSDVTLYACWSENTPPAGVTYTIFYNANNGDGYMVPTVSEAGSVQLSPNIFYRPGFSFEGWSTVENGEVVYKDNATVMLYSDMNLYAVWKEVQYFTITFHANNGTDATSTYKVASNLMPAKLPYNTFENGGKKFTGWESKDKTIKYIDGDDTVTLSNNIDLYATWYDNPVTIKFDAFNGTDESIIIYTAAGNKINLPKADFTRNGYELLGSYTCYADEVYDRVYRFGEEYAVPNGAKEVVFSVGWRKLPEPPLPVFGGNSTKYKDTYVLFYGVNTTKSDWIESLTPGLFYGVWNKNAGWYDSSQWRYNMCWAGTSSNMLHWWYDRNKESIEKYYAHYASDEALSIRPPAGYYGEGVSDIFTTYRQHWIDAAYKMDVGLAWYLFGTHYNKSGGGYFKEVLGEDSSTLIEYFPGITQYVFNTNINKVIENGMVAGLAEINGFGSHAITLWGVHFDKDGLVDGVIVSDSGTRSGNNAPHGYDTGLIYMHIEYDTEGRPFMTNDFGSRLRLTQLVILGNGEEQWKKYFETHKPIR